MAVKGAGTKTTTLSNGDERPTGLYAKMAYLMGQVGHVPKNGFNEHFKYYYVREVDLTEHLRPLMAELGLLCIPSQTDDVSHLGEGKSHVMYVRHEFHWVDAESGESFAQSLWAAGQDGQDKASYKALTGGVKYALMKTLLVPTGDDPEAENGSEPPQQAARTRQPTPQATATNPGSATTAAGSKGKGKVPPKAPSPPQETAARPAAKAATEPAVTTTGPQLDEEDVEQAINTAQVAIAEYLQVLHDDEVELNENEQNNTAAARQLAVTTMEDRPRFLKALTRAQEYLEKLLVDRGYVLEEEG